MLKHKSYFVHYTRHDLTAYLSMFKTYEELDKLLSANEKA